MTDVLDAVRAHLRAHFARTGITGEPDAASVTFLGAESIDILRFGPDSDDVVHYVSLGCSRYPMTDPADIAADPVRGPRAEVTVARTRAWIRSASAASRTVNSIPQP